MKYCPSVYGSPRRLTRVVDVGGVHLGGSNPVRLQSMLTCDTMDTEACIRQTLELVEVGCEIVRITAPTVKDAANLEHVSKGLRARGCHVPLVADIHFKPEARWKPPSGSRKSASIPATTPTRRSSRSSSTRTSSTPRNSTASASASPRSSNFARSMAVPCASARTTAA